jgi:hypothetical protein
MQNGMMSFTPPNLRLIQLKAKRLGLLDDFRTFRMERPWPEFFEVVVA